MISLNGNLKQWFKFGWIDEAYLMNLKERNIISEEEYYDLLININNLVNEDLLFKMVTKTSSVL